MSNKFADAILVSDIHLTDVTPVARTDDYMQAQKNKLTFLSELSAKNGNCPVLSSGDVFDYWKGTPLLCSMAYEYLPRPFVTIPGQHDLPGHSLEQYHRSALSLLESVDPQEIIVLTEGQHSTGNLYIIGRAFGTLDDLIVEDLPKTNKRKILLLHELTWEGQRPAWDKNGWSAAELMKKFGGYFDLIVTGDNHKGFVYRSGDNKLLINPGSMLRKTIDQVDYQPTCYLYYAKENNVVPVSFPIDTGVLSRQHLERKDAQEARITSYISQMQKEWEVGVSFEHNLKQFLAANEVSDRVKDIIYAAMEEDYA